MESSSHILNHSQQSQEAADEQINFSAVVSTGGRNQYVELERFESEEQFQQWMAAQGRKWGIVQKGRVTIEDIIDQYACVYRRRKGYACRVQMRVRHNRRSGLKVVEILPFPHDHTFYGATMPHDLLDETSVSMVNPQNLAKDFVSIYKSENLEYDQDQGEQQPTRSDTYEVKEELDFSMLTDQVEMNMDGLQQHTQPIEMLWSNILNNPAIQQFANGIVENGFDSNQKDGQQEAGFDEPSGGLDGSGTGEEQLDQTEAMANLVAERVAGCLAVQFEPKFDSILNTLNALTKSVEELKKRSMPPQQHPPKLIPMKQNTPKNPQCTLLRPFLNSMLSQNIGQQQTTNIGQQRRNDRPQLRPSVALAKQLNLSSLSSTILPTNRTLANQMPKSTQMLATKKPTTLKSPLPLSTRISNMVTNKAKFGLGLISLNSPMKTSRKSVHAYRQRRRELSYKFMKEVGMSLTINGVTKSIFLWRSSEIVGVCQAKRKELAQANKRVIYRSTDITEKLYRVDCSRELVNGRRCGQMIADSLWPRGYFQTRMLMPILKGVSHRAKKRVDGSARKPVANDQFEIFKVALLLLGGFLMDEMDRSKWMETAREGVNQRGLDELANSKRAHYEYEGGPLFGWDDEGVMDDDDDNGLEAEVDEEAREHGDAKMMERQEHDNEEHQNRKQSSIAEIPISLDFLHGYEENEGMDDDTPPPLYHRSDDREQYEQREEESGEIRAIKYE